MSKIPKPPVTSSIGIEIKLPDEYSVSGDTDVAVSTKVEKKSKDNEDTQFLEMLHTHLEGLEKQRQVTINMINILKRRLGFCCGKDKK